MFPRLLGQPHRIVAAQRNKPYGKPHTIKIVPYSDFADIYYAGGYDIELIWFKKSRKRLQTW